MPQRRKRVRHDNHLGFAHALTFSCYGQRPLLRDPACCRMLSTSIDNAAGRHGFGLLAFVYMPDHVHLLAARQRVGAEVSRLLSAIKRPFSTRVRRYYQQRDPDLVDALTVRERPGRLTFRFWQEGPGFDRNICNERSLTNEIAYFHDNPVRAGLCRHASEWKWSSWRHHVRPCEPVDPDLPRVLRLTGFWNRPMVV